MELSTLDELLVEQLQDIYSSETQLNKALPAMIKKSSSSALKDALSRYSDETQSHISRLDSIGKQLHIDVSGKTCKAMEGVIAEAKELISTNGDEQVRDAAIVAAAQRADHYEICAYGTAKAMAQHLGKKQVVEVLKDALADEYQVDQILTKVCKSDIFPDAPTIAHS